MYSELGNHSFSCYLILYTSFSGRILAEKQQENQWEDYRLM